MKIFPNGESIANRKTVKWGIDPTGNRLHLGHFVSIRFLRKMIDEHRDVTVVIGSRTARIGDPSGTVKERPVLDKAIIGTNAKELRNQIGALLPQAKIIDNGEIEWGEDTLLVQLGKFTVAELIDRHAFKDRPVRLNELTVPILQGMDSCHIGAEVEVGGEDQEFNFAITRKMQELWNIKPEVCVLLPIINGTDGNKMSKSLDNCVWIDQSPDDMFGRIMSISDETMEQWIPALSDIIDWPSHPKTRKEMLAQDIIAQVLNKKPTWINI